MPCDGKVIGIACDVLRPVDHIAKGAVIVGAAGEVGAAFFQLRLVAVDDVVETFDFVGYEMTVWSDDRAGASPTDIEPLCGRESLRVGFGATELRNYEQAGCRQALIQFGQRRLECLSSKLSKSFVVAGQTMSLSMI